jgi:hypothetical protein
MPVSVQGATFYPAVIKVGNDKADGAWILRPGMTVNVDTTCAVHTNVWKLPSAATSLPPPDPRQITRAAQEKLDTRQNLPSPIDWVVVWKMGEDKKPWPIFVRVGGMGKDGKPGIKESNSNYVEVLEWDPTPSEKNG